MARKSARKRSGAGSRRRRKSRVVPLLVLTTVAGTVSIAAYTLLSTGTQRTSDDEAGVGIPVPDVREIGAGGAATISLKDKDDPSRVVAVISYDSQAPIGQGRYDTVNPRAWVYLEDGSSLHIRADQGRFYAPDEQRPQTGVMRGNVVVRLFEPSEQRPAEDAEAPVVARLASLSFDTEYGALWTDEPVLVVTPEIRFAANDLRIVVNQVQERIELLEVRRGESITYTPLAATEAVETPVGVGRSGMRTVPVAARSTAQPDGDSGPAQPVTPGGEAPEQAEEPEVAPPRAAPEPAPVHYAAQFRERVRLTQEGVSATGDLLEVWARVIDNRLPEGAVGTRPTTAGPQASSEPNNAAAEVRTVLASMVVASAERRWPPAWRSGSGPAGAPTPAGGPAAPFGPKPAPGAVEASPEPTGPGAAESAPVRVTPTATLAADAPVTLEWTGPLTLRPLAAEPAELEREHLAARLTGGESGSVAIADSASGADGSCARLEYGFTTGSVVLAGVGESGTRLSAGSGSAGTTGEPGQEERERGGTLRSGRTEYSVATGVGRVPGPGTLEGSGFQRIAWSRQMDFVLGSREGRVLAELEEVIFQGDVRGEDEAASFESGFARATFAARPDAPGASTRAPATGRDVVLRSIFLDEAVTLRGGEEERVSASSLRVEFEPSQSDAASDRPAPSWFEADGGVVATRPGERVAAEHIEATLAPGANGKPEVRTLGAAGEVDFRSRREGIEILGDDLDVDVPAQRMRLGGTVERLARVVRGPTTISGVDVRLSGKPREARVLGMGAFAHEAEGAAGTGAAPGAPSTSEARATMPVRFDASWSQAMTFVDSTGALRCVGEVKATMREGASRIDRLSAWTVEALIEPAPEAPLGSSDVSVSAAPTPAGESASEPTDAVIAPESPAGALASVESAFPLNVSGRPGPDQEGSPEDQNRRLLSMVATGSIADSPDGEPAQIESRRYGPPAADGTPVLQQLLYLEGARILVDNAVGTLDVPGAGKLVVVDRRTPDAERPGDVSPLAGGTARGDALFDWQGSLAVDRDQGRMTMTDRVRMTHRRSGDGVVTQLNAPMLTARAAGDAAGSGGLPGDGIGRLLTVRAEGGAWVQSGEQELTAEVIDYDADTGMLTAFSPSGGSVRVAQGGSVWTAAAVRWDMVAGRIEIIDPGGLVSPR